MYTHWSTHYHADVTHPNNSSVSVVALNEGGKIRVTWSRPTLGPGQMITSYSVQYRRRGTTSYTTRSVSGSSTTSYTITNLNLGAVYEVRVASVGPLGWSGYCCGSACSTNWLPVDTYIGHCPPHFVYARAIFMGFSFTFECKPQSAWLILCLQDLHSFVTIGPIKCLTSPRHQLQHHYSSQWHNK